MIRIPTGSFFDDFKDTHGALSCCESIAIANIAASAPPDGVWIELGSYKGKSAISAASILDRKRLLHMVDPIYADHNISNEVFGIVSKYCDPVLVQEGSPDVLSRFEEYSYVFVDSGDHQSLPMIEVKILEDKMCVGGIVCFHDFNSQFLQVREAYDYLLGTGKYEEIKIDWDAIVNYVRENDLEKGNNSWHHNELDFPCFVGALKRK